MYVFLKGGESFMVDVLSFTRRPEIPGIHGEDWQWTHPSDTKRKLRYLDVEQVAAIIEIND